MNLDTLPTLAEAEAYLAEAEQMNPGAWIAHSRHAARAARAIAAHHPRLDPQAAYIMALLHDIGRRAGVHHMRHALDGYRFLLAKGHPAAARGCLTHSYPLPNPDAAANGWDGTPEELAFMRDFLCQVEYNDYDRLLQLCDCLALPQGLCLIEKRFVDVVLRYGFNEFTIPRWKAFLSIKAQFEQEIGCSVYSLLPGVIETTFA